MYLAVIYSVRYALTAYPEGRRVVLINASVLTRPGDFRQHLRTPSPKRKCAHHHENGLRNWGLQAPLCLGLQRDATSPLGVQWLQLYLALVTKVRRLVPGSNPGP